MTEQTQPTDAEHIPHTCGGFSGAFFAQHKRMPSAQEIWAAAIRSYRDLNRTPAGAGEPTEAMIDAGNRARLYREHGDLREEAVLSARTHNTKATWFAMCDATPQPTQAQAGAVPTCYQSGSLMNTPDGGMTVHLHFEGTEGVEEWFDAITERLSASIKGADHG